MFSLSATNGNMGPFRGTWAMGGRIRAESAMPRLAIRGNKQVLMTKVVAMKVSP